MTLQDIFDQLAYGELAQVFTGDTTNGADMVAPAERKKYLLHVQLGLTELHKRFLLNERTLAVQVSEAKRSYVLDPRYASTNVRSREQNRYIQDGDRPFRAEIFKIERVYKADGAEFPLNKVDNPASAHAAGYNTLLLPDDYTGSTVKAVCRADHDTLDANIATAAPTQVQINLPGSHLWALLLFIAHRVVTPVGMSNEFHDGNNYLAKFEAECQRLTLEGYQIQQDHEATRFENNGWV